MPVQFPRFPRPLYRSSSRLLRLAVFVLLAGSVDLAAAQATVTIDILVESGQPSPDGNGVFSDVIKPPVLNDAGEVAVWANLLATDDPGPLDDWGFFVADRSGIVKVFRGGESSALGNPLRLDPQAVTPTNPASTRPYALDGFGRIVLAAPDSTGASAVYRGDGVGRDVLAQEGDVTGLGTITDLAATAPGTLQANAAGQAVFLAFLSGPGQPTQFSLLRADSEGLVPLLFSGQALPDGRTVANIGFQNAVLNDAGSGAAPLNTGSGSDTGIYAGDGESVVKLLHSGEAAPDGLGTLIAGALIPAQQNNNGQMLAMAPVDDIGQDYIGLFTGSGSGLNEVTRTGAATPDGSILNLTGDYRISNGTNKGVNDDPTLIFGAVVASTQGNVSQLIMRREGVLQPIVSAFRVLPDPIGLEVRDPFRIALNDADQVLFSAFVLADGVSRKALFLNDPEYGLVLVARTGQSFAGDVLADIEIALPQFPGSIRYTNNAQDGFNNFGELAFQYRLANGQAGIALAKVEFEPGDSDLLFKDGFEG